MYQIDGLVQDCSNSSALAIELLQSCTKPSKCPLQMSIHPLSIPTLLRIYNPQYLTDPAQTYLVRVHNKLSNTRHNTWTQATLSGKCPITWHPPPFVSWSWGPLILSKLPPCGPPKWGSITVGYLYVLRLPDWLINCIIRHSWGSPIYPRGVYKKCLLPKWSQFKSGIERLI